MKAIIFDCFGVLTTDGWKQLREEFFAHDKEKMRHAIDIDKAVNAGYIDYDEFIAEIVRMSGLGETEVRARLNGSMPNKMLFQYIRDELKPRYKIGILSNAAGDWLNELFEPWQVQLFDAVVLSYQVGAVKPEPTMYKAVLNRLAVTPEDSVFIDDSEGYVAAAEDLGIKGIYHQDTNETIAKIRELLHA